MSVVNFNSTNIPPECFTPTAHCFLCGERLAGQSFVMWQGADERGLQIWLHPPCSKRLADKLNADFSAHDKAARTNPR